MKSLKCTLVVMFTVLGIAPAFAQRANVSLEQKVDSAVRRAQSGQVAESSCPCATEELTIGELIEAEEELQHIRNTKDNHATFEKYPYLLNPVYRRHKGGHCPFDVKATSKPQVTPPTSNDTLDIFDQIAAEEELGFIRNQDIHASFEKYPYLLDPAYRHGNEQTRQQIRQNYKREKQKQNSTWARKVGL